MCFVQEHGKTFSGQIDNKICSSGFGHNTNIVDRFVCNNILQKFYGQYLASVRILSQIGLERFL